MLVFTMVSKVSYPTIPWSALIEITRINPADLWVRFTKSQFLRGVVPFHVEGHIVIKLPALDVALIVAA